MRIEDVKQIIVDNNIREDLIKINDKYLIPGMYYLYYDDSVSQWASFYYDREYTDEKYFSSENSACRKFLELIFSEPTVFKDFSMREYRNIETRGKLLIKKYLSINE